MKPETARAWLTLARDLLIGAAGLAVLIAGALAGDRTLVIVGAVLIVVASGLAVHVELARRNGGGGDD